MVLRSNQLTQPKTRMLKGQFSEDAEDEVAEEAEDSEGQKLVGGSRCRRTGRRDLCTGRWNGEEEGDEVGKDRAEVDAAMDDAEGSAIAEDDCSKRSENEGFVAFHTKEN